LAFLASIKEASSFANEGVAAAATFIRGMVNQVKESLLQAEWAILVKVVKRVSLVKCEQITRALASYFRI
jgi:hypothetical protein